MQKEACEHIKIVLCNNTIKTRQIRNTMTRRNIKEIRVLHQQLKTRSGMTCLFLAYHCWNVYTYVFLVLMIGYNTQKHVWISTVTHLHKISINTNLSNASFVFHFIFSLVFFERIFVGRKVCHRPVKRRYVYFVDVPCARGRQGTNCLPVETTSNKQTLNGCTLF